MVYNSVKSSLRSQNFIVHTGDGNTDRAIAAGFQPDMVWYKERGEITDYTLLILLEVLK